MTSNIGSSALIEAAEAGADAFAAAAERVRASLRDHFRPEFLNRIDEIIVFQPLSEAQLMEIVRLLLLAGVDGQLAESAHLGLEVSEGAARLHRARGV